MAGGGAWGWRRCGGVSGVWRMGKYVRGGSGVVLWGTISLPPTQNIYVTKTMFGDGLGMWICDVIG